MAQLPVIFDKDPSDIKGVVPAHKSPQSIHLSDGQRALLLCKRSCMTSCETWELQPKRLSGFRV